MEVYDKEELLRENSNIISFVPALELKKANMVKLPVIVNNQNDIDGVIRIAVHLRGELEAREAIRARNSCGFWRSCRPKVIFNLVKKFPVKTKSISTGSRFLHQVVPLISLPSALCRTSAFARFCSRPFRDLRLS